MIYLVEDDDSIRKLVCYALSREGYDVQGFSSPKEFWQAMDEKLPKLILLDIMLPQEDGLTILKKLKKHKSSADIPVMMLTAKDSEFDKVTGLDLGADDYIAKPFGITELISRVRAVLRRYEKTNGTEGKIYEIEQLYVNPSKHIITVGGETVPLSYKEYCLLMVLLEAEGKVVRRDELLYKVWGDYVYESRTLDVHIRKLRVKLGESGSLIETVKNIGYKIGGDFDE